MTMIWKFDRGANPSVGVVGFDKIERETSREQAACASCLSEHRLNLIDTLADDVDTSCPKHWRDDNRAALAFRDRPDAQCAENDPL